jgi:hypothetical protein
MLSWPNRSASVTDRLLASVHSLHSAYPVRSSLGALLAFCLCFFSSHSARAQANAIDGVVNGYVTDASHAALPKAPMSLRNIATGYKLSTIADERGYYRFPLVPTGTYQLTVSFPGFKTVLEDGITLKVGQQVQLDVALSLGTASETVEVKATASMLDSGAATIGAVVGSDQIDQLPLPSRNVYNFIEQSPGTIGIPNSAFQTPQITFGGTERSQWNLDGIDDTQHTANRTARLVVVSADAVDSTQTLASGYSAEFGRAGGGQVNIVLKSGTNQFHGSVSGSYRPSDLQAIPTLSTFQPSRSWRSAGATIGGPILHDRAFFFAQYEDNPYTLPQQVTISAANVAALNIPATQITTSLPFGETYRTLASKVTYKLNPKNSGFFRYARFTDYIPANGGGLSVVDRSTQYQEHANSGGLQLATLLSPNLLNEFRFGVSARATLTPPIEPIEGSNALIGALVNITGVANIGYSALNKSSFLERNSGVLDNLTWTRGRHTLKTGFEYDHEQYAIVTAIAPTFSFSGVAAKGTRAAVNPLNQYLNTINQLTDPATGNAYTYTSLTAYSGNPNFRSQFNYVNAFVQDEFRLTPRLVINAGLRYEVILFPIFDANAPYVGSRTVSNDYRDLAPRFGFSWSPNLAKSRTVVHGAFGLYYDVPSTGIFNNAGQINGNHLLQYNVVGVTAGSPAYPTVPDFSVAGAAFKVRPSITAFDPNFHNGYQEQGNLQIVQDMGSDFQVTLGYQYAGFRHGLYAADANLTPTGVTLADGRPTFTGTGFGQRPISSFGSINVLRSGAKTNFNGTFLNVQKQLSHGYEFSFTYTYSHALADNIGEGGIISDPTNVHRDYGNADDDVRHNFVMQGLYHPTFRSQATRWINGLQLSTITNINSGFPINEVAGPDLNGDGVANDRPFFVGRNSLPSRRYAVELGELSYNITLKDRYNFTAFVQSENLLNTNNLACAASTGCTGSVINAASSPSFLKQTSASTSRNVSIGGKFRF